jgi:hypothetical protein
MKKIVSSLAIYLYFGLTSLVAQEIVGLGARYDDSFREWDIFDDSEAVIGEFQQRWQQNNDWSEWDIRYEDSWGSIRQKTKGDNGRWELRLDGETVTIKMNFPNDPSQWIITDNNISFDYTTRYANSADEWQTNSKQLGKFSIAMFNENDPRDWEVFDELNEKVSPAIKLAFLFTTIMVTAPKK